MIVLVVGMRDESSKVSGERIVQDLQEKRNLPLDVKVLLTKTRILQWYEEYKGNVYVSFSGGKDSTVLLHLVRSLFPDVLAVYIDTGLEYKEVRNFVATVNNVRWIKPKYSFIEVIKKYGYPVVSKEQSQYIGEYRTTKSEKLKDIRWNGNKYGRGKISEKWKFLVNAPFKIGSQCCTVMKKNPSKKFEKETGLKPYLATMTEESALRKSSWIRFGCNGFKKKRPTSQPMSFWTEQDVLQYIAENNLPYAACYGDIVKDENGKYHTTLCDRTGCEFCLYGIQADSCPNRLQRIKKMHPKRYEFIMRSCDEGGLGYKDVIDWINKNGDVNIEYD